MRGTPGHSFSHAVVDLREIALENARAAAEGIREAREEAMPEHEAPWKDLPLPAGAPVRREHHPLQPQSAGAWRAASPPLASSFPALLDDGRVVPPDTEGAVGPNHVVTMINSQVRVHDRSGRDLVTTSFSSFWTKVTGNLFVSDPRIEYDPSTGRWIASAIAFAQAVKESSVLVGASQTGDPTGAWNLYRIIADPETSLLFADYPTLGFNRDWIAVQVNMYGYVQTDPTATQQLVRTQIYAFEKGNILAGGSDARHTLFTRSDLGATQVPAVTYDAGESRLFLLEEWNGNLDGMGYLRLLSISGPVGSEVFSSVGFPATGDVWDFAPRGGGDFGPQKDAFVDTRTGKPILVQIGNADLSHVVFRNGLITAAHTVFLPAGGATRSAVQWWQLATDGSVVQRGRLDDPTGRFFYAYPSIAPNRNNDLLLGYSVFAADQYPSAGYCFRAAGDPPGTLRSEGLLKAGDAPYAKSFGSGRNRWGDYSVTVSDPANGLDLWTIQEYSTVPPQPAPISWWGTWWGRIAPEPGPAVPLPAADFSAADAAVAGEPVAFRDISSGATAWFWNFGDGLTSNEQNPVHAFPRSGAFTVLLTAVNQTGAATANRSITIAPTGKEPPEPISGERLPRRISPRQ
jgi:PKD domain